MSDMLQQAIAAIKSGDKNTGKQLLLEILTSDQRNEGAWLWMTQVASSDHERMKCLQNVLKINPNNETAKHGIALLQQKQSSQAKKLDIPPTETPSQTEQQQIQTAQTSSSRPIKPLKRQATKKCPYCAETIKAEAVICRFCSTDLVLGQTSKQQVSVRNEVSTTSKDPLPKKKKSNTSIVLMSLILLIGCFCCVGVFSQTDETAQKSPSGPKSTSGPTPTTGPTPIKSDPYGARAMCEHFVTERLKAPSTAEFHYDTEEVYGVTGKAKNYHIVIGQVDAQNAFGAMLRTTYRCELHYDIHDPDTWYLDNIEVE